MLMPKKSRRTNPRANGPAADDVAWREHNSSDAAEVAVLHEALKFGEIWAEIVGVASPVKVAAQADPSKIRTSHILRWQPALLTDDLSHRELQTFLALARGASLTEVARQLYTTIKSVSTYTTRIREKTGLINGAQIAVYAYRVGLTTWPLPDYELERCRVWRKRKESK